MEERLPKTILHGKKRGFAVPMAEWFRGPLKSYAEEMLRPERLAKTGIVRPPVGKELMAQHAAGSANKCRLIWNLICFLTWHELN